MKTMYHWRMMGLEEKIILVVVSINVCWFVWLVGWLMMVLWMILFQFVKFCICESDKNLSSSLYTLRDSRTLQTAHNTVRRGKEE